MLTIPINKVPDEYLEEKKNKLTQEKREYTEPYLNTIMYRSKHGNNDDLNGKAHDNSGQKIVCRHLSTYLVNERGEIKDYHNSYSSVKNIESVAYLINNENNAFSQKKSDVENYIFSLDKLGLILAKVAGAVLYNKEKVYGLQSENHSMAISLTKKRHSTSYRNYYVIKFYDPNKTNSHVRIISNNLQQLKNLKLSDMLSPTHLEWYFPNIKSGLLICSTHPRSNIRLFFQGLSTVEMLGDDIQGQLYFLVKRNFEKELLDFIQTKLNNISSKTIESLLKKDYFGNSIIAYLATQVDDRRSLGAMMKVILNSKLDNNIKLSFITGNPQYCYLAQLMEQGWLENAKTSIEAVINSNLKTHMKYIYLMAKTVGEGAPGLFVAMQENKDEMIKLFIELVLDSNLDNPLKSCLISPIHLPDGDSVFFRCMGIESFKMSKIYIDAILSSELDDAIKTKLLLAKRKDGLTSLYIPFQNGYSEIIMYYVTNILSSKLSPKNKTLLLSPVNPRTNQTGLDKAMYEGHLDTVEKFTKAILGSNLPEEHITNILNLNDFKNAGDICACLYDYLIKNSKLDPSNKRKLYIREGISFPRTPENSCTKETKRKRENEIGSTSMFFQKVHIQETKEKGALPRYFFRNAKQSSEVVPNSKHPFNMSQST